MAVSNETNQSDDPEEIETLKRENAELREKLNRATNEAKEYRTAAYGFLEEIFPYTPPTDAELKEMMEPDEGESLRDIIDEFKRELNG